MLIDNYYDTWAVHPTLYESRPIEPGDIPEGHSHFGRYFANSRAAMKEKDPLGYALIEKFLPPQLTYEPVLPDGFTGTFLMSLDPEQSYTFKAQHLRSAVLSGDQNANLTGNAHTNLLQGNSGDNALVGGGGGDRIVGGDGIDTAVFSGASSDYEIEQDSEATRVTDRVEGRDGSDYLFGIEFLQFSDETIPVPN